MIKINYVGLKCGICSRDFQDNDDVVVCPDCGTPMHRSCYSSAKKCPFEERHAEGYVFEEFDTIKASARGENKSEDAVNVLPKETSSCPVCGERNKPGAMYCNRCGTMLRTSQSSPQSPYGESPFYAGQPPISPNPVMMLDPLAGVPADTKFEEDVTAADLACYVKVNTPYYMTAFSRMKQKRNRFNFSAAIFSGVWFLYRKQYKLGVLILSINALLLALMNYVSLKFSTPIIESIVAGLGLNIDTQYGFTVQQYSLVGEQIAALPFKEQLFVMLPTFISIIQLIVMIVLGIFGNRLYYRHCIQKVKAIKNEAKSHDLSQSDTSLILNSAGGVNTLVALIFAVLYLIYLFI